MIVPRSSPKTFPDAREVGPDTEEWSEATRIGLEFNRKNLSSEVIEALHLLWSQIKEISHLRLDLSSKELTDENLIQFCCDDFLVRKSINSFELNLQGCQISNEALDKVLFSVLKQTETLTSFKLQLAHTSITDKTITMLAKNLLRSMPILEAFQLSLLGTAVTDQSLVQLFVPMPKLKNFMLNVSNTKVSNQTIEALGRHSVRTMKTLESFELYTFNTKVNDEGLTHLFVVTPSITRYVLGLSGTLITDQGLQAFADHTLPSMQELTSLELYLSNTKVTDSGLNKIFIDMRTVTDFILGLSNTSVTDQTVDRFAKHTMMTFKVLETFELYLFNTEVTDESLTHLFSNIKNVKGIKKYILGLSQTDVTDQTIELFAHDMLPNMNALENLELYFSDTSITDQGVSQLFASLRDIKKLVLDINYTEVTDKSIEEFSKHVSNMKVLKNFEILIEGSDVGENGRNLLEQLKSEISYD